MGNNVNHATALNDTITLSSAVQDTITLSNVTAPVYHTDTIDLSMLSNTVIGSPYTVTTGLTANTFSGGFNTGTGWNTTGNTTGNTPWMTQGTSPAPKIQLNGEGADVEVNGWSLVDAVKRIEERLGLFQPNPELEHEWEDLQALGEQYRKLEQHIRDKQATFDRLRAMPAPDLE
jgi:hypothetical protein